MRSRSRASRRRELGGDFGGVWIDNDAGGAVRLGVADTAPGPRAEARSLLEDAGLEAGGEVEVVEHPYQELTAVANELGRQSAEASEDATLPLAAGVRPDLNAVELEVPRAADLTAEQTTVVEDSRAEFGGDLVRIDSYGGAPDRRSCGFLSSPRAAFCEPPLRGGVAVSDEDSACTTGFTTRSPWTGQTFMATAGHCRGRDIPWSSRFPNWDAWHTIGRLPYSYNDWRGDAGLIRVDTFGWAPAGLIYWRPPTGPAVENWPIRRQADPIFGQLICTSGAQSRFGSCGLVTAVNVPFTDPDDGITNFGMVRAAVCGTDGDSGAPVFLFDYAQGMQVAGSGCDTWIQPIGSALNNLGVQLVVTP